MKIGDKVRFLSEVGGGVVRGFQGKDIALVEGEDGLNSDADQGVCGDPDRTITTFRSSRPPNRWWKRKSRKRKSR